MYKFTAFSFCRVEGIVLPLGKYKLKVYPNDLALSIRECSCNRESRSHGFYRDSKDVSIQEIILRF